jgi:hypothetical protein
VHLRACFIDSEEIMAFAHWLTVAAMASLPFAVAAQQTQHETDPINADAPVSGAAYVSVFKDYQPAADEFPSPDKTWRTANEEAGRLGGHGGHMKDGSTGSSTPAPAQAMPADHSKHQ